MLFQVVETPASTAEAALQDASPASLALLFNVAPWRGAWPPGGREAASGGPGWRKTTQLGLAIRQGREGLGTQSSWHIQEQAGVAAPPGEAEAALIHLRFWCLWHCVVGPPATPSPHTTCGHWNLN